MTDMHFNIEMRIAVDETIRRMKDISQVVSVAGAMDEDGKPIVAYVKRKAYGNDNQITHNGISISEEELNKKWFMYCKRKRIPERYISSSENGLYLIIDVYALLQFNIQLNYLLVFLSKTFKSEFSSK